MKKKINLLNEIYEIYTNEFCRFFIYIDTILREISLVEIVGSIFSMCLLEYYCITVKRQKCLAIKKKFKYIIKFIYHIFISHLIYLLLNMIFNIFIHMQFLSFQETKFRCVNTYILNLMIKLQQDK